MSKHANMAVAADYLREQGRDKLADAVRDRVQPVPKVVSFTTRGGNPTPNQHAIFVPEGVYFQSYASTVAFVPDDGGPIELDPVWDSYRTTMGYLRRFLREHGYQRMRQHGNSTRAVRAAIKAGDVVVKELNS